MYRQGVGSFGVGAENRQTFVYLLRSQPSLAGQYPHPVLSTHAALIHVSFGRCLAMTRNASRALTVRIEGLADRITHSFDRRKRWGVRDLMSLILVANTAGAARDSNLLLWLVNCYF
jgi:hypothetical protein